MAYDANDPADKKILTDAVNEAVTEAVDGLKSKNSELLGKVKKLQKNAEIDPDDYNALQAELDQTTDALKKAEKVSKAALKEAETFKAGLETESKYTNKLLVEDGLTKALIDNGVTNKAYLKAAIALHANKAKVIVDGDQRVAKIGDQTLGDFGKEWTGTDEGKSFVSAPINSGSGAGGDNGADGGDAKQMKREEFEEQSPAKKMELSQEGVVLTD